MAISIALYLLASLKAFSSLISNQKELLFAHKVESSQSISIACGH
jgi:hypothetical protein